MALLIVEQPKAADIPALQRLGFAYNSYTTRWESKKVSREYEQTVCRSFSHLVFRLSKPEQHLLQLSPATDSQRPGMFWLASSIPTRNIPLNTRWDKKQPERSLQAARAEAAKLLGCQSHEIEPASSLLILVKEGHKWCE